MKANENFWSRRRAGVAAEEAADVAALEAQKTARDHAALEEKTDAEILAALDLPDPDDLVQGDDFSGFMAKAVPDHIRRRALRTLWRSNPVLANVDMLVDYGEDFTDASMVIENMQTTYQVGKGMLKHVQEMARQAELAENPPQEPVSEAPVTDDLDQDDTVLVAEAEEDAQAPEAAPDMDEHDFIPPAPRRMTFHTEDTA